MSDRLPPQLDLMPDGRFRAPQRPPILTRIFIWATIIAVVALGLAFAALALWIAMILVPIAIAAALIAWLALRFQLWRAGGSIGSQRDLWRR
jgi:hypothetical protein